MSLIFLTNLLMTQQKLNDLKIPATFVCFGYVEGMLFKHYSHNQSTFLILESGYRWGNTVVYGALYHIDDYHFYVRQLDGYMRCSLSSINSNHRLDLHHRVKAIVTPIRFNSLDELDLLLYTEDDEQFEVDVYIGNPKHPNVKTKLNRQHSYKESFRVSNGVDALSFIKLYEERNGRKLNE